MHILMYVCVCVCMLNGLYLIYCATWFKIPVWGVRPDRRVAEKASQLTSLSKYALLSTDIPFAAMQQKTGRLLRCSKSRSRSLLVVFFFFGLKTAPSFCLSGGFLAAFWGLNPFFKPLLLLLNDLTCEAFPPTLNPKP